MRKPHFILFLLAAVLISSCKFKLSDRPNWDVDVLAPLVKSRVSLSDAITDSSLVQTNPDNSLTLVLQDTVIDFSLADFLEVPDTSVSAAVSLDSIRLTTDSINQRITLREIVESLGLLLLVEPFDKQPSGIPFAIPPQSGVGSDPVEINASDLFQEAELLTGYMDLTVTNNLPTNIDSINLIVRNLGVYGNTDTVLNISVPSIPQFTSWDTSIFLGGLTVESSMEAIVDNARTDSIPAGTYIDLDGQYIELNMTLRELGASRATAIFPEQDVADKESIVQYNFGSGIEITKLNIKEGWLKVKAVSTINDTLRFTYILPVARKGGDIVNMTTLLLPAPVGGEVTNIDSFALDGYSIDLTKNGEKANVFEQIIRGKLLYSGNLVTMDLTDSIFVDYSLVDIIPNYIEGYIGTQEFTFNESAKFEFFNNITGGTLDLENPKLEFRFVNSIGVDGEVIVNDIKGINNRTGTEVSLIAAPLSSKLNIPGPRLPNVGQEISTTVSLDKNNSNIRDFINLLPDSLYFDLKVDANKNGNPALRDNFATDQSKIAAVMDIELPLHGMTDNLTLETELDMDLTALEITDKVDDGTMKLYCDNWFPFEATAQIFFYDDAGSMIDSLFVLPGDKNTLNAGIVNAEGVVETPTRTEISAYFDNFRLNRIRSMAQTARVRFSLTSIPTGDHVKLYSTYGIDFKLVGDFKYHLGN